MSDMYSRLRKLATTIKTAQGAPQNLTAPMAAGDLGGGMPNTGAGPVEGAMGTTMPGGEGGAMPEEAIAPLEEEAPAEEGGKELDSPTPWIVKFHNDNFWIGKVFPSEYIEEAVKFFSQRKSVPKEQVREYLEKLKEGKKEEMPQEMQQAPELEEGAAAGAAPAPAPEAGAAAPAPEQDLMSQMP